MGTWRPATEHEVITRFERELALLPAADRERLERVRVAPRAIPVADDPGHTVVVVAEHAGRVLYWSDVEGGWECAVPDANGGGIGVRGSSQFELGHVVSRLFDASRA